MTETVCNKSCKIIKTLPIIEVFLKKPSALPEKETHIQ